MIVIYNFYHVHCTCLFDNVTTHQCVAKFIDVSFVQSQDTSDPLYVTMRPRFCLAGHEQARHQSLGI